MEDIIEKIKQHLKGSIVEVGKNFSDYFIYIEKSKIKEIIKFLKANNFEFLMDLFAVDYLNYPQRKFNERFEVIYNIYSYSKNQRIFIKALIDEKEPEIDSIVEFFDAANWYEREVYDMYGIKFIGHPNLKRILMYEEFEGHPLRKDYPFNKKQPRIPMREPNEYT